MDEMLDKVYEACLELGSRANSASPEEKRVLRNKFIAKFVGDNNPGGSPLHPDYAKEIIGLLQAIC